MKKKPAKALSPKALKAKRASASAKAWETRRKNERELERKRLARKRARAKAKAESFAFGANVKAKAKPKKKTALASKKVAPKKRKPTKATSKPVTKKRRKSAIDLRVEKLKGELAKLKKDAARGKRRSKKKRYWLTTPLLERDVREAQKKVEKLKRLYGIEPEGTPDERPDNFDMALIADQTNLTINEIYTLFYTPDGTTL